MLPINLPETPEELLVWTMEYSGCVNQNFQNYFYKKCVKQFAGDQSEDMPRSFIVNYVTNWVYRVCRFAPESVKLKPVGASYDLLKINGIAIFRILHDTEKYRTITKILNK